jgi:CelD/BcsL family acetyltransferase involved in cellulose biosynthesis
VSSTATAPATRAAAPSVTTEMIEDEAGLELIRDDWDQLAVDTRRPGSRAHLLIAWWRHVAPPDALTRVVAVREGERLIGLAPFLVTRASFGIHRARLFGTPSMPQRMAILCRPADAGRVAAAVGSALAASHPRPAVIDLDRIDAADAVAPLLARRWPSTLGASLHQPLEVPAPVLAIGAEGFEGWLAGKSRNFRKDLRRTRRGLEQLGARISPVEDMEGLDRAIDAFRRLHGNHWGFRSSLWTPQACAMLCEAGEHMIGSGGMRVYTVEVGGAIVSVEILFAAGGEVASWNTGWDPAWAEERVSMAGLFAAIEDCFERGDIRLDFGEGTQPYKLRIADGDDPVAWATVLARGASYPAASAVTARARWKRAARGAVRRLPEPALERVRSVKGALRGNPLHAGAAAILGTEGLDGILAAALAVA